jgi:hypothetical protein
MKTKRIKYREGQWFAVPLRTGGYAPGIIVRGDYKTKGGLGYFFPIRSIQPPNASEIAHLNASQATLISWFGDLGIAQGRWPLIFSERTFSREDWLVPRFGRIDMFDPERGWITEYSQGDDGRALYVAETRVRVAEIADLPEVGTASAGYVEVKLAILIDALEQSNENDQK